MTGVLDQQKYLSVIVVRGSLFNYNRHESVSDHRSMKPPCAAKLAVAFFV